MEAPNKKSISLLMVPDLLDHFKELSNEKIEKLAGKIAEIIFIESKQDMTNTTSKQDIVSYIYDRLRYYFYERLDWNILMEKSSEGLFSGGTIDVFLLIEVMPIMIYSAETDIQYKISKRANLLATMSRLVENNLMDMVKEYKELMNGKGKLRL